MMGPGPCVAVQLSGAPPPAYSVAVLEARCDGILGKGACRVAGAGDGDSAATPGACWSATIIPSGGGPAAATVILRDPARPQRAPVNHDLAFRPHDAPVDRWATVGLLIAALVTIEQHSDGEGAASDAAGAPPRPPHPPPVVTAVVSAPGGPPPLTPAPRTWAIGVAGVTAVGLSPGVAWGVRIDGAVTPFGGDRFGASARLTYLAEQTRADASAPTRGGAFRLISAGGGACAVAHRARRLGWRLCAGADVNVTLARGFGIAEAASPAAVWGAAWAGATARLRLRQHVAAWASLEGAAAINRPGFAVEGGAQVFRPAPIGAMAALGVAVLW